MFIPAVASEITAAALNQLFESAGARLPTVSVVNATPLDGGNGYLAQSFRLHLTWSGEGASGAPPTLVAKLPLPARLARPTPDAQRMFRREAMFHRQVAPYAPLNTAKAWVSELDSETGAATMVFEDLRHLETFSDDTDISLERLEDALRQMATMHARYWRNDELNQLDWLANPAQTGVDQVSAERFKSQWPTLVQSGAYSLSSTQLRLGEQLSEKLDAVYSALHAGPWSLIHADLHQENLFFAGSKTTFIDWQLAERANPAKDVAKLTASCLRPGTVEKQRPQLLETYLGELHARGTRTQPDALMQARTEGSNTSTDHTHHLSFQDLERYVHLSTCHYLAMMTFLSDARDFDALAADIEGRTDFTTSRVIAACDSEAMLATVEGI